MKKKNVKYIGAAVAAALLAAGSPVVVPILIPTITVQADGSNLQNPDETPTQMLTTFKSQFDDRYVASTNSITTTLDNLVTEGELGFFYFGPISNLQKSNTIYDIQNDGYLDNLKDDNVKQAINKKYSRLDTTDPVGERQYFRASGNNYYYSDILGYLTVSKDGKTIPTTTPDELQDLSNNLKDGTIRMPLTVTIHLFQNENDGYGPDKIKSLDSVTDPSLTTFSFTIDTSNFDIKQSTKTPTVNIGSTMSDTQLSSGTNSLTVKDNYTGDSQYTASLAAAGKPIYGQSLFKTAGAALGAAGTSTFDPTSKTNGDSDATDSNGTFTKAGTYYQTISYNLMGDGTNGTDPKGADQAIGHMIAGDIDNLTNSTIAMYETRVNGKTITQGTDEGNYAFNKTTGLLTVVRPVQIGGSLAATLATPSTGINTEIKDVSTTGNSLMSGNDPVDTSNISYGDTYYTDPKATVAATDDEIADGKFLKAGTYYRKVTFTLASGKTSDYNVSDDAVASDTTDTTVTFVQQVNVQNSATGTITNPTVNVGSSITADDVTKSDNDIKDSTGTTSLLDTTKGDYAGVSFGKTYYDVDDTDANEQAILDGTGQNATTVDNGTNFTKSGDYLRTITFYLTKEAIANNTFSAIDPNLKINYDESTVTFVQQIHINGISLTPSLDDPTVPLGTNINSDLLNDSSKYSLKDGDTSIVATNANGKPEIDLGTTYYDDQFATQTTSDITSDGKLTRSSKPYYRKVVFHLADGAADKYSFTGGTVDKTANTVTYVETVDVSAASDATSNVKDLKVLAGTSTSGKAEDGTNLTDTTGYTLTYKDDNDVEKNITPTKVVIGDYYDDNTLTTKSTDIVNNQLMTVGKTYYRKITYTLPTGDGYAYKFPNAYSVDKDNDTVTYLQAVTVDADVATVNVGDIDTYPGQATADTEKDLSADTIINTSTGNIVDSITFDDTNFYSTAEGALNQDANTLVSGVVENGNYAKTGSVYRRITFKLNVGEGAKNTYNDINGVGYNIEDDNITFIQKVNVVASTVSAKINNATAPAGTADVTNSTGNTVTDDHGNSVVTDDAPTFDGKFYDSVQDLKDGKESTSAAGGILTQSGDAKYYRTITFTLKAGMSADDFTSDPNFISKTDTTVTYAQAINVSQENATATYNESLSDDTIQVGTGTDNKVLTDNTTGYTLTADDTNKTSLVDPAKGVTLGTTYYDSAEAALNAAKGETESASANVINNKFNKIGPYYRTITFNMNKGVAYGYVFSGTAHYIDYANDTITYVQEVNVGQENTIVSIPKIDTYTGIPIDSLDKISDFTLDGEHTGSLIPTTGDNNITIGDQYYTDPTTAMDATGEDGIALNNVFIKNGKFYRKITFNLIPNAAINDSFTTEVNGALPKVNGTTSVTYLQEIDVAQNIATATLTTEAVNADTNIADVPDKHDSTLVDSNNHSILQTEDGTSVNSDNSKYYDSMDDYKAGKTSTSVIDGKFTKAGTYYRTITFNITTGAGLGDQFNGDDIVERTDDSVTYLQPVIVNSNEAAANIVGINDVLAGTSVNDSSLQNAEKSDVTNQYGSLVQNITFGNTFYDNASDVITGGTESAGVQNGKLAVGGNKVYYHAINFQLTPNALEGNNLTGVEGKDYKLTNNADGTVTVTYAQPVTVKSNSVKATIDSPTVNAGSTVAEDKESNDINLIVDGSTVGTSIVPANGVSFGTDYYDTTNANNTPEAILGKTTTTTPTVTTDVVQDGTYVKAGTYYRKVIFKLDAGTLAGSTLPDAPIYSVDGDTVTYLQTITINPLSVAVKANTLTVMAGTKTNADTLTNTDDYSLVNGENTVTTEKSVDTTTYYKTVKGALDGDVNDKADLNGSFVDSTATYYRVVTFTPAAGTIGEYTTSDPNTRVNLDKGTVTYAQAIKVEQSAAKSAIAGTTTPIGADAGSSVSGEQKDESNTVTGVTSDGTKGSIIDGTVSFGTDYYSTQDAKNTVETVLAGTANKTDGVVSGDSYIKPGTYYRTVTVPLQDGANLANSFDPATSKLSADGKSVTYVQTITIGSLSVKGNADTISVTAGTKTDDSKLTSTAGYTLTNGDNTVDTTVSVDSTHYYKSAADALAGINEVTLGSFVDSTATYYRVVTFTPAAGTIDEYTTTDPNTKVNLDKDTVTYAQAITVEKSAAEPNIAGTTTSINVDSGSSVSGEQGKEKNGIDGINADGTKGSIVNGTISFGTDYYLTTDANNTVATVLAGTANKTDGVVSGDSYVKSGTYYRTVTVPLKDNANLANSFDPTTSKVSADGKSVTYVQTITINANKATIKADNPISATAGESITSLPAVDGYTLNVAGDKVSTKVSTDNKIYKTFSNKALSDELAGNEFPSAGTYYRVITFTPTDASEYSLDDPNVISNENGVIKYVQTINVSANPAKVTTGEAKASVGDATTTLPSADGYTLNTDDAAGTELPSTPSADTTIYKTYDPSTKTLSDPVTSGTFDAVVTYYRKVTFTTADADKYSFADANVISNKDGVITYVQPISVGQESDVKVGEAVTATKSVKVNISGENSILMDKTGYSLTGANDKDLIDASTDADGISFSPEYYSMVNGVLTPVSSADAHDYTISKKGVYYRKVIFKVSADTIANYDFKSIGGTANTEDNTVSFIQEVDASTNPAKVTVGEVKASVGDATTTLPSTDGYTLNTDDDAGTVIPSKPSTDNKVYKTYDASTRTLSDPVISFDTVGTYYRVISFTTADASEYSFDDPNVISNENGVVTYVQTINVGTTPAKVNSTEVSATVGDKASSLTTAANATLTTADGGNVEADVTVGKEVYRSLTGALTKDTKDEVNTFDDTNTYYRVITFKPKDGNAKQYSFDDKNVQISADGTTITYAQPITVKPKSGDTGIQIGPDVANKTVKVDISSVGINEDLESTVGYTLKDGDNSLIDTSAPNGGIGFSAEYYELADATKSNPTVDDLGAKVDSNIANLYTITKPNDYYRKVIFNVTPETIENYDFASIGGKVVGNTVVFVQKVSALTNPAYAKISTPSVSYNTSADSSSLKDPTSVTLKDAAGKDINSGTPELSGIFSTSDAAKNATSDTGDVTGNLKAGTYYQRVTFPLADNDDNAYDFGDGVVAKDGKSVTYIRTITVNPSTGGGSTGGNTGNNTGNNGGSDNNTGNGSGDEDDWTYYKDPGVVTTKTTQPSYTLNNRANDTVKNRALAEDTSWITDQYRTNRAGVKQYHVATNEWIDANDVYFRENENNNNTDDDWTYYKDPGVVTTKEDQPAYALNNRANGTVKNRELAENTSWITDQYRTNKEGVKQYRVATGEWIDSHDVIFTGQAVNEDDGWTYYKDAGVVVTKPDQQYYSLNNKANDTVKNRALLEQTSWLTDQYRTNKEGVKQYRVATNEWIDSHDVIFVKDINRIVNVDETNTYYSLYTIYGKAIKNRALEEKTSWRADKIAYDGDGNVYYRVATNEWVQQVDGVYLDTNAWYK